MADTEKDEGRPLTLGEARETLPKIEEAIKSYLDDDGEPLGDLTSDELGELREKIAASNACKAIIDAAPPKMRFEPRGEIRRPALGAAKAHAGRGGDGVGEAVDTKAIEPVESARDKFVTMGPWKSLGHFAHEVRRAGERPGTVRDGVLGEWNTGIREFDNDIKSMGPDAKAISGMSEFSDPDGASFVPIQVSQQVWERSQQELNLLSLVDSTPVQGNGYTLNAWNDKSRTSGTLFGGAKAYWGDEGAQLTSSKPTTRKITWKLNKLHVLMFATDELMEDTLALDARLSRVAGSCFADRINSVIVNGTGAGQPLGLLRSAAKVTQTAESGQGANTVVGLNVTKMFSRRAPGATDLVWLYNVDVEPQLDSLNLSATNTGINYVYTPPGGFRDNPEPRLKGRRMIECEYCPALGTEGDLILWQPSSYGVIVKSTGIKQAVSMHLRFDYDEVAFKWTFRIDGRPYWDDVLTPATGSTRAPIVTLHSTRT